MAKRLSSLQTALNKTSPAGQSRNLPLWVGLEIKGAFVLQKIKTWLHNLFASQVNARILPSLLSQIQDLATRATQDRANTLAEIQRLKAEHAAEIGRLRGLLICQCGSPGCCIGGRCLRSARYEVKIQGRTETIFLCGFCFTKVKKEKKVELAEDFTPLKSKVWRKEAYVNPGAEILPND